MAKAYRRNFIDGQSLTSSSKDFSFKLFAGWDFAIIGEKAMKRKQRAMTVDLEVHFFTLKFRQHTVIIQILDARKPESSCLQPPDKPKLVEFARKLDSMVF